MVARTGIRRVTLVLALAAATMVVLPAAIALAAPVPLGTTSSFAVLAGTTITNTGPTTITGDVPENGSIGLHPGGAWNIVGITLSGAQHLANAVALKAKNDLITAYDDARLRTPTIIGTELAGLTLKAGVYHSTSGTFEIGAGGTLTLDGEGDPDAVFVFQTDSTLVTFADSRVAVINQARFCRIFWKVGSSATLGTDSIFRGHIFALTSITAQTRATIEGQLLARNGAVTLDSNTIINGLCPTLGPTTTTTVPGGTTTTVPGGTTTTERGEYPFTGGGTPWYSIMLPVAALALLVGGGVAVSRRRVTR
jgi:hypothetical protein